ncbi:MAG: serine/threonine protein kinase [Phycisphaerales bacterium]|nr:serine/threonine protein kinase [Phycisphaerales bacterium]
MDELSAKRLAAVLFKSVQAPGGAIYPHISGYNIHGLIGRGGGGDVYEGTVESTARPVAIKVLRARHATNARDAFRELDRLAQVRSQVVPHVLDYGWYESQIYIVTEYIDGVNPREFCRGKSLKDIVKLIVRIADAVSVLHSHGILHRDLKPSNILIARDGSPVLLDLGIASLACSVSREADGQVQGTTRYMSPEQAAGRNSESTTSWDVYAMGVLSLELLTDCRADPSSPEFEHELNRLPRGLQAILRKSTAITTWERYETAQQFRDDLTAWLNKEPTLAGKSRPWSRLMRVFAARPILTSVVIGLIVIGSSFVASLGLVLWQSTKPFSFESSQRASGQSILTLLARNGNVIHTWRVDAQNSVGRNSSLVKANGRDLAVVGLGKPDINSGQEGLMVFGTENLDQPLWVASQTVTPEMAHVTRFDKPPHLFHYMNHYYHDIFPERPGDEILSLHRHNPSSLCAIQIHSIDGELLSEYYHDGWLKSATWLPNQRKLVFAGQNSDGTWVDRGAEKLPAGKYPIVIFAITPQFGSVGNSIGHPGLGLGIEPDWYRCVGTPEGYTAFCTTSSGPHYNLRLSAKPNLANQGVTLFQLGANTGGPETSEHITMEINSSGVQTHIWSTDQWGKVPEQLDPDRYQLIDLPPRITARDYEPMQPPAP